MNEDELKTKKSVSPPEKSDSGESLSSSKPAGVPPRPQRPGVPPKPPRPPKVQQQSNPEQNNTEGTKDVAVQTSDGDDASKQANKKLEEEIEIAQLQCDDDDNAALAGNEDEVIKKSYKTGLSDQDKQRKKRKLKRLLLLLLILFLFAGSVTATYFIVKNKTEYVPEFYDNVAIEMDFSMERSEDRMPGDNLILIRPVEVLVRANTEEINYDVVALGIRVTAKFTDTGEDCSEILDVGICDISQIYDTDEIEYTGGNYIHCASDLMLYYKKVLEPGDNEKLINAIRINADASNEYAKKEISIKIEIFAVYPNPAQIRAETSEFKNAPQGWVEEVYEKMTDIFKERAKNK